MASENFKIQDYFRKNYLLMQMKIFLNLVVSMLLEKSLFKSNTLRETFKILCLMLSFFVNWQKNIAFCTNVKIGDTNRLMIIHKIFL